MNAKYAMLLPALLLAACAKKAPAPAPTTEAAPVAATPAATPAPAPTPVPAPAPATATTATASSGGGPLQTPQMDTANLSDEQKEVAKRQAKLDYSNMEDGYINDASAQWASSATATSNYGSVYEPVRATGKVDGKYWSTNNSDVGFDTLEVSFEKPVNATQLRVAISDGFGLEGVTKLELQDTDGKWNTVWSGVHTVKADKRGTRTWLVQPIEKTSYKAKAARITKSNNVTTERLEVDAVQLVGS
ncbi:hypothetical protein ABT364_22415 [Massilia sp. SR12]